jgi:hypothetical protein
MGTGAAGGLVYQLAVMPDGTIIAVGTFTSMGGVANTNKVAKWERQRLVEHQQRLCGHRAALAAVGANGILYVGGSGFTIGGTAVNNVAQYNGSAWSAVGAGIAAGP